MVMIRCPHCGQRVLDIATSCPQCHEVLIQNPMETHNWGTLQECGRCHKHIERDVVLCPYCGHRVRATRIVRRVTLGSVLVLVVIAAGVAAWRAGVVASVRTALFPARMPEQPAPAEPVATVLEAPREAPPEATGPPVVATVPDTAATTPATTPATSPGAPPATSPAGRAAPPVARSGLVVRWTGEWANVRADRTIESEVVRVLAPGLEVQVGDMQRGWWALYADGALIGYIANSVLRTEPT